MKTLAIITVLALAGVAHAEELNLATLDSAPNRVQVTTGAEYGFVAGIGYSRIVPVLDRRIALTGEATLPFAGLDLGDFRVRASALVPIVGTRSWKLAGAVAPILRGTSNTVARLIDAGVDTSLVGGYYTRRGFVAGEAGFDAALATHVTNSDAYRMQVNENAVDGWYANAGALLRAGIQAGVTFGRYDLAARLGMVREVEGDPPLLPFYGTVSMSARW